MSPGVEIHYVSVIGRCITTNTCGVEPHETRVKQSCQVYNRIKSTQGYATVKCLTHTYMVESPACDREGDIFHLDLY